MKCHYRAASVIRRKVRLNALIRSLGRDCDENAHEGGHGRCRQNGIALLVFGLCAGIIAR